MLVCGETLSKKVFLLMKVTWQSIKSIVKSHLCIFTPHIDHFILYNYFSLCALRISIFALITDLTSKISSSFFSPLNIMSTFFISLIISFFVFGFISQKKCRAYFIKLVWIVLNVKDRYFIEIFLIPDCFSSIE